MFMIPVVSLLMGAIFLKLGIRFYKGQKKFANASFEVAVGTISDIVEVADRSAEGTTYSQHPVIEFMYQGSAHSVQTEVGVKKRKPGRAPDGKSFAIGDTVEIRIDNADPNTAILNAEHVINTGRAIFVFLSFFGIGLLILGLVSIVALIEETF